MAALATFFGATDAEETIPTELINFFVQHFEYTPPIAQMIAWLATGKGTIPQKFPRWGSAGGLAVPAGTKVETDTFTDVDHDQADSSIQAAFVGFRVPVSDEVDLNTDGRISAGLIVEAVAAFLNRVDVDTLAPITDSVNIAGAVTRDYTAAEMQIDLAQYKALHVPRPSMGHALVLHGNGAADLLPAILNSAAPRLRAGDIELGPEQGFLGTLYRTNVFETDNVPTESTGHAGCLTPIGRQASGLGLVMNEPPNVRPTRGDDAEVRAVTYLVFRALYGTGLTNPRRIMEVRHQ